MKNVNPIPISINTYHNHPAGWKLKVFLLSPEERTACLESTKSMGKNNCDGDDEDFLPEFRIIIPYSMEFQYFHNSPSHHCRCRIILLLLIYIREIAHRIKKILPNCNLYEGWNSDRRERGGKSNTTQKQTEQQRKNRHLATLSLCSSEDKTSSSSPHFCRSQFMKFTVEKFTVESNIPERQSKCRRRLLSFVHFLWDVRLDALVSRLCHPLRNRVK